MKKVFVVRDGEEIITIRDTMDNALASCINRISLCGYFCNGVTYGNDKTVITYRDIPVEPIHEMRIESVYYKEGI